MFAGIIKEPGRRWLWILVALVGLPVSCAAEQRAELERVGRRNVERFEARTYRHARGQMMPYRLFVPAGYDAHKKYPLVLYLHGGGGRGDDNVKQVMEGNGAIINLLTKPETQEKYASIVVAPQCPEGELWTTLDEHVKPTKHLLLVLDLLAELQKEFSIDAGRIYVAGQSMGGYGSWALVAERPSMFAAALPLCGGGDTAKAAQFVRTPVWAFHGERDESVRVELSRRMVAAIREAGGQPRYTEYKGEGHVIWNKVAGEPELVAWFFAQKRN